jgi:hypothetical protein
LATVREFKRQIGLLEGLEVEFVDGDGHVLGDDRELGLEWPYTRRTRGRVTVGEWRRTVIAPLLPELKVWVIAEGGFPVAKRLTLKRVRATGRRLESLIDQGLFELDGKSAVIVIGDRHLAAVPSDLGDAITGEGPYGLAVVAAQRKRPIEVLVTDQPPGGVVQLAEATFKIHSRVLRIQDTQGQWHTDIPCKKVRISLYGESVAKTSVIVVVVTRRPAKG